MDIMRSVVKTLNELSLT